MGGPRKTTRHLGVPLSVQSVIARVSVVAAGRFAPGHLGELTQIVPFEMVDAALESAGAVQSRVRELPSRVVVYLLLAGGLFAGIGYRQVWARLVAGLGGADTVACPGSSALAQARRRIGAAPLRELFELLRGPAIGADRWRGLLVCAIDGTMLFTPNSAANLAAFGAQPGGPNGDSGYPMLRLLTVVACGTRTVIDAVFCPHRVGETTCAPKLLRCLTPGMVLLADRNFAVAALIEQISATGADLLIRAKNARQLPTIGALPDGSRLSRIGSVTVRVIDAEIVVRLGEHGNRRTGRYRLITTLTDHHRYPARDIVALYHQRWEIETSYLELKSTILGGRVLRAHTPAGIAQEVYALLVTYQALRIAIADAVPTTPDRGSFTIALHTARDQVVHATGIIADTVIDLVGAIGRAVRGDLLPTRRTRVSPRVVKRAISKHRAKGDIDRTNYQAEITINILRPADLTTTSPP
jgi:Insertion element 4 transposase N-terminal/Transposase DDE domain